MSQCPPDNLPRFAVCSFGNGACVDNTNIGLIGKWNNIETAILELTFQGGRFGIIQFAAQCVK